MSTTIDITKETLLTIEQARQFFPNKPSMPTLWRWVLKGTRGSQLESVLIGGRRYTSEEACLRFVQSRSLHKTPERAPAPPSCVSQARQVLDQLGI